MEATVESAGFSFAQHLSAFLQLSPREWTYGTSRCPLPTSGPVCGTGKHNQLFHPYLG